MGAINRSDALLSRHPWHAVYWPLIAAFVYSFVSAVFLYALTPDLLNILSDEGPAGNREKWIYASLLQGLILVRMCLWAEKVSGEPFGGPVHAEMKWFAFAVLVVPLIHWQVFEIIGGLVSSGEGDWTTREDFDTSMFTDRGSMLMLVYVILLAPIVEEVGFRGILLGFLRGRGIPEIAAVIVTAAGFALLHTQYTVPAITAIFLLGLVLGWLRLASGSLGPPIIAHIAVNTLASL
jgi:membrane protease YdiL (CAAX protease family)